MLFVCFRLVCLSFCIYNRKNTYTNIKKKNIKLKGKHIKKNIKKKEKNTSPSQTLRDICFSRSGRGLDIMYFCVLFMFFFEFLCLCFVYFCLLVCFRLVFLSFCIYNRKNTYKNIKTHKNK